MHMWALLLLPGACRGLTSLTTVRRLSPRISMSLMGEKNKLDGKRVLLTGASGGLGSAAAVELGGRGARLALHYYGEDLEATVVDLATQVEAAGGTVDLIVNADFRSPGSIEALWKHVDDVWGDAKVDALLVGSGAARDDGFTATMSVDCETPFALGREAKRRGASHVVFAATFAENDVYKKAAKAALNSLTADLAAKWASDGVALQSVRFAEVENEKTKAEIDVPSPEVTTLLEDFFSSRPSTAERSPTAERSEPEVFSPPRRVAWSSSHADDDDDDDDDDDAPLTQDVEEARAAATRATKKFGATSPQAVAAWDVVEDCEGGAAVKPPPQLSLSDECALTDDGSASEKCRKLADELRQLDELMAAGPEASVLREAAKRILRDIEKDHDDGIFGPG